MEYLFVYVNKRDSNAKILLCSRKNQYVSYITDSSKYIYISSNLRNKKPYSHSSLREWSILSLRPIPNVVLLPCRTQMNLARHWHDDSTAAVSNVEPNEVAPNSEGFLELVPALIYAERKAIIFISLAQIFEHISIYFCLLRVFRIRENQLLIVLATAYHIY